MKTKLLLGALLLSTLNTNGQEWLLAGNPTTTFGTDFLGTTDDERLTLRTYDKFRLVVNEEDAYNIGSFTGMPAGGFIGISPSSYFWDNGPGPFSRLHLAEPGAAGFQSIGYRPWMRNGISLTGNSDQMYVGQKYTYEDPENPESGEMDDFTDAIIQWSDNPGTWLSDRMRFIFTSEFQNDPTGNGSMEGLEAMQLFPDDSGSEVLVGIGDWYAAGVNPSERLDVLDRTVRIRRLVPDYEDQELEKFVVTDDDGRLHWRDISNLPDNCEWSMSSSAPNHVLTAFGASDPACPDEDEFVGIGTTSPTAKLDVRYAPSSGTSMVSQYVEASGSVDDKVAGSFYAQGTGDEHYGMAGRAYNAVEVNTGAVGWGLMDDGNTHPLNVGVQGLTRVINSSAVTKNISLQASCDVAGTTTNNYGVHSEIWNMASSVTNNYAGYFDAWTNSNSASNYGIYTTASGGTSPWALYVNGNQFSSSSNVFTWSDPALKTNIQPADIAAAGDLLNAVELHTYEFDPNVCPQAVLPNGTQLGVLAPELEALMPQLVREAHQPATYDEAGVEIHPGMDLKAVSYTGFIPYLIAAYQDQQAQITALQQDLAACCESRSMMQGTGGGHGDGQNDGVNELRASDPTDQRLTITPNPFSEGTVIGYTLPKAGMVSLQVSDASGKSLFNLFEGQQMEGTQRFDWNTSFLAPGMYHVTLLVDGAPLVKKAVKVAR